MAGAAEGIQPFFHTINFTGEAAAMAFGDKDRLEQVVQNLLTNAIKYSPDSRKVALHNNQVSNF